MAGSGNIIAKDIQLDNLSCSLASSGEIEVIGTVDRASFNVAGSGEIKAFDCQARKDESIIRQQRRDQRICHANLGC